MIAKFISEMFTRSDVPIIKFAELERMEEFHETPLDDIGRGDIMGFRIPLTPVNLIIFRNIGKKGAKYIEHGHDCIEKCKVRTGGVKFKSKIGTLILRAGDPPIIYPPGLIHSAEWIEDGEMYVEFKKVYN